MSKKDTINKYKYLIGSKINKWTVLDISYDRTHVDAFCECECGTRKLVCVINLINNLSKDCGCGRKQMLRDTKTKDLTGKKFFRLKVVELLEDSNKFKRRQYRCICDCGKELIVPSESLITGHTKSCGCLLSYYNSYIEDYLKSIEIDFIKEYRIEFDGGIYRFDFYIPDKNLVIEYDGSQHYKPNLFIGFSKSKEEGIKRFEETQHRDREKDRYCELNNINILRIPYWESKNIKTIINNHLQRLSGVGSN